MKFWP
jgi:hypothetical protein